MSILKGIMNERREAAERNLFIEGVHENSGIDIEELNAVYEDAIDSGIYFAKSKVFEYVWDQNLVESDRSKMQPTKFNPVAKNARKFNKSSVQRDRKKDNDRGYSKHKSTYEDVEPRQQRTQSRIDDYAKLLFQKAIQSGASAKDVAKRAQTLDKLGDPKADAMFKAANMMSTHEQRMGMGESTLGVRKPPEGLDCASCKGEGCKECDFTGRKVIEGENTLSAEENINQKLQSLRELIAMPGLDRDTTKAVQIAWVKLKGELKKMRMQQSQGSQQRQRPQMMRREGAEDKPEYQL
jgi:hypothetical protein